MDLLRSVVTSKSRIIKVFQFLEISLVIFSGVGLYNLLLNPKQNLFLVELGLILGKISLLIFILAVIPGIFRRFNLNHQFLTILILFRRHLGILAFLTAQSHYFLVYFAFNYAKLELLPSPNIVTGLVSLFLTFPLFITSNDWSVKKLGVWWKRLHKIIYLILWTIFLHVVLQRWSIWSIFIGIIALLEVISLVYVRTKNR